MAYSWNIRIFLILMPLVQADWYISKQHQILEDSEVEGKQVLVVGDVHGCFDELIDLLDGANLIDSDNNVNEDALIIFVGDTVNKGPKSLEAIRWIQSQYPRAMTVTGNHELNVLEKAADYYPWTKYLSPTDAKFLADLPWTIAIPFYNTRIVHAGLFPNFNNSDQSQFINTRMRNLEEDSDAPGGYLPNEESDEPGDAWSQHYSEQQVTPEYVVFGHDASRGKDSDGNIVIQKWPWTTGLDTRCVSGGELTGVFLPAEDESYVSVQCPNYDPFAE